MKRRVPTIAVCLLTTALAGGCSSTGPDHRSVMEDRAPVVAGSPTPAPTATDPFEGDGAAEIWRKADRQSARATSFHVVLKATYEKKPLTMDMTLAAGPRATGTMTVGGYTYEVRRIKKRIWMRAGRKFWESQANKQAADLLAGRWVTGAKSDFKELFELTEMSTVHTQFISTMGEGLFYTGVDDGRTLDGHPTVVLSGRGHDYYLDTDYRISVNVSADQRALPMRFVALSPKQGASVSIVFTRWNTKVTVKQPTNVFTLPSGT